MCTVTWLHDAQGFHLLHNRDELHTRRPAHGPRIHERDGVRFIAPVDANAGGTWIGVNEYGLAACLLNRYDAPAITTPANGFTSRGLLLMSLLAAKSMQVALDRVIEMPLGVYQPFQLVLAQLGSDPSVIDWTGASLHIDTQPKARLPLVSSSVDGVSARQVRGRLYHRLHEPTTLADLRAFHASHEHDHDQAGPSAYSVCMHRADAQTVSYTEITLMPHEAILRYHPGPPCEANADAAQLLGFNLLHR